MEGILLIIGGNEEKKGKEAILQTFADVCECNCIGILTTASSEPEGIFSDYEKAFKQLNIVEVTHFDIQTKNETEKYIPDLEKIDGFFISGGKQEELADIFMGSRFLQALRER